MNNYSIDKLCHHELIQINGGEISTDTSFSYDIGWWLGRSARAIRDLFK